MEPRTPVSAVDLIFFHSRFKLFINSVSHQLNNIHIRNNNSFRRFRMRTGYVTRAAIFVRALTGRAATGIRTRTRTRIPSRSRRATMKKSCTYERIVRHVVTTTTTRRDLVARRKQRHICASAIMARCHQWRPVSLRRFRKIYPHLCKFAVSLRLGFRTARERDAAYYVPLNSNFVRVGERSDARRQRDELNAPHSAKFKRDFSAQMCKCNHAPN